MEYLVPGRGTTASASPLPNCPMEEIKIHTDLPSNYWTTHKVWLSIDHELLCQTSATTMQWKPCSQQKFNVPEDPYPFACSDEFTINRKHGSRWIFPIFVNWVAANNQWCLVQNIKKATLLATKRNSCDQNRTKTAEQTCRLPRHMVFQWHWHVKLSAPQVSCSTLWSIVRCRDHILWATRAAIEQMCC